VKDSPEIALKISTERDTKTKAGRLDHCPRETPTASLAPSSRRHNERSTGGEAIAETVRASVTHNTRDL
jgi:hypothetical protein